VRELRKWLDWFGPRYFGLVVQDTWIAAPPERRRMIEEMARALESVHREAARWAQYYIECARRAEAEGRLRPRVILAQVLRGRPGRSPHWETGRNGSQKKWGVGERSAVLVWEQPRGRYDLPIPATIRHLELPLPRPWGARGSDAQRDTGVAAWQGNLKASPDGLDILPKR